MANIFLNVNGCKYDVEVEPNETLGGVIRERLHLNGTKVGCASGICGACTVIMDEKPVLSCIMLALQADGKEITTIEGLEKEGQLHPLQQSFIDHFAFECGFCTSGMIMNSKALIDANPNPTQDEIKEHLAGNICRCAAYPGIIEAVSHVNEGRSVSND